MQSCKVIHSNFFPLERLKIKYYHNISTMIRNLVRGAMTRRWRPNKHSTRPLLSHQQQLQPVEQNLRILLLSNAFNSMSQRAFLLCKELQHEVHMVQYSSKKQVISDIKAFSPDLIICPFLTKKVPEEVYTNKSVPCLIVHPGIEGDRGASSIDWALAEGKEEWGVTVLQADEEMDAGDIWSTNTFPTPKNVTKSELYRGEVADAAMKGIKEALERFSMNLHPRPLDYSDPKVKGTLCDMMSSKDRKVDWDSPARDVAKKIRASDSRPGASGTIHGEKYLMYGAFVEEAPNPTAKLLKPGTLMGQRNGAVLSACSNRTAVWISHMKKPKKEGQKSIKLPAAMVLDEKIMPTLQTIPEPPFYLPMNTFPKTFQDIFAWDHEGVTFLWANFYNGAMSTTQCRRLEKAFQEVKCSDSNVLVFMGGPRYFSNGIHLNVIEAAADPAKESWDNIVAIDDCIKQLLQCSNKLTVAALHGNAGAGGAMMALAADQVWMADSVVLNPSYAAMNLFGSEYWTYSLPRRVGNAVATQLTKSTLPVSAKEASEIGMADLVMASANFTQSVVSCATSLAAALNQNTDFLHAKQEQLAVEVPKQEACRAYELEQMRKCFQSEVYHQNRSAFVL